MERCGAAVGAEHFLRRTLPGWVSGVCSRESKEMAQAVRGVLSQRCVGCNAWPTVWPPLFHTYTVGTHVVVVVVVAVAVRSHGAVLCGVSPLPVSTDDAVKSPPNCGAQSLAEPTLGTPCGAEELVQCAVAAAEACQKQDGCNSFSLDPFWRTQTVKLWCVRLLWFAWLAFLCVCVCGGGRAELTCRRRRRRHRQRRWRSQR
jgi:hypothetical protein